MCCMTSFLSKNIIHADLCMESTLYGKCKWLVSLRRKISGIFHFLLVTYSFYLSTWKYYFSTYNFYSKRRNIERIVKTFKDIAHANHLTKSMACSCTVIKKKHYFVLMENISPPPCLWLLRNVMPLSEQILVRRTNCHVLSREQLHC